MRLHRIGMRTIKTSMAVAITLLICEQIGISNPFFAAIAAIIAMEASISATLNTVKDRFYGTVLGAVLALTFSLIMPINWFTMGLGILVVIYTCNLFKWVGAIKISTIVFIAILLGYEAGSRWEYAFFRILDTTIGLVIGTLINYYLFPYKMGEVIYKSMEGIVPRMVQMVDRIGTHEESLDLERLKIELASIEDKFEILKKDLKLNVDPEFDSTIIERLINRFENLYVHLAIIDELETEQEEDDLVLYYHTRKIVDAISEIKYLKKILDEENEQRR